MSHKMLIYTLIRRAGTDTLPPGFTIPQWEALAEQRNTSSSQYINCHRRSCGGYSRPDDCESEDFSPDVARIVYGHAFRWVNENLTCFEEVKQVKIERKPVTNAGFLAFCKGNKQVGLPVSWMEDTGEIKVQFSMAFCLLHSNTGLCSLPMIHS
ncbi:hypothetical protein EDD16DRAFT_406554 [Pisolithus croceorrhizus]|nr:hypothetical protein EDD16DRAFT_406554 [Pisolithus croceorrhizus]KAI6168741.1 hypothetical protein EDD17DRAFT_639471 [Pisolithus thermaeus]